MPRRFGKTTQIVGMANEIAKAGRQVYIITVNHQMAERIQKDYGLDPSVVVCSEKSVDAQLRGRAAGYIFFDEVSPDRVSQIMAMMPRSVMVAAYYTAT